MKRFAIAAALSVLSTAAFAQHSGGAHKMVMPSDLKWANVPLLPPGAEISVIEGPMNEAAPFTIRLNFPEGLRHSGSFASGDPARDGSLRHVPHGHRRKFDKTKNDGATGAIGTMQPGTNHFAWTDAETICSSTGHAVGRHLCHPRTIRAAPSRR